LWLVQLVLFLTIFAAERRRAGLLTRIWAGIRVGSNRALGSSGWKKSLLVENFQFDEFVDQFFERFEGLGNFCFGSGLAGVGQEPEVGAFFEFVKRHVGLCGEWIFAKGV
jgi:hypothetical protein